MELVVQETYIIGELGLDGNIRAQVKLVALEETWIKIILPKKRKLSQDNIIREMNKIFDTTKMEDIEQLVKPERPFIKRFISQAYEGDYYTAVPLRVAKIIVGYIQDSCKNNN